MMKRNRFTLALLCTLGCSPLSCKSRTFHATRTNAFETLRDPNASPLIPDSEVTDFSVKTLADLGINHKIVRVGTRAPAGDRLRGSPEDVEDNPLAFFNTRITFGAITAEQFEKLKAAYGGSSQVIYDPARKEWDLIDFLPSLVQALDGHRFVTHDTWISEGAWFDAVKALNDSGMVRNFVEKKNGQPAFRVSLSANCHGTAYEVARIILTGRSGLPTFTPIAWGPGSVGPQWLPMLDRAATPLTTPAGMGRQRVVFSPDLLPIEKAAERNAGRKLGDVLQFSSPADGLLHSAVWIDQDLFFEKTDTASSMPYRLISYADMVKVGGSFGFANALTKPNAGVAFLRFDRSLMKAPDEVLTLEGAGLIETGTFTQSNAPASLQGEMVYLTNYLGFGTPPKPYPAFQRLKYLTLVPDAAHAGRAALPPEAGVEAFFVRN